MLNYFKCVFNREIFIRQIFYVKSKSVYFRCTNWLQFEIFSEKIFKIYLFLEFEFFSKLIVLNYMFTININNVLIISGARFDITYINI